MSLAGSIDKAGRAIAIMIRCHEADGAEFHLSMLRASLHFSTTSAAPQLEITLNSVGVTDGVPDRKVLYTTSLTDDEVSQVSRTLIAEIRMSVSGHLEMMEE